MITKSPGHGFPPFQLPVTTPTLWGDEVTISADPNAFGFDVTGLQSNEFAITWSDTLGDIHGRRFDSLGSFNSTDFLFNLSQNTAADMRLPELVQQEDGSVRVLYSVEGGPAEEDIFVNFANFDTTGGAGSGYFVINSAKDEFKLGSASTEFNNSPNTAVVYTELRGATQTRDLYLVQLAPNGLPVGSPVLVPINAGESVSDAKVVGLPNGNTLVTYTAQKFDAATNTVENFVRYRVYDDYTDLTGARNASSTPGNDSFPAVAALEHSSDGFVIATQDALGIRFLYHGFGHEFTKSVPGTLSSGGGAFPKAIAPKITALKDQGFIIAWTDTSETESDGSPALKIGIQRFDKDANAVGGNLFINHPGDQSLSSIATLADGRVILTFDNETGDATNHFTHDYQIIDPRGRSIDGTFHDDNIVSREDGATLNGYDGNDTLLGRAGNDTLDGGTGNDVMKGAKGNDTYVVDSSLDVVTEESGGGLDTVVSSVKHALEDNVENLVLTGTANINGTGNALDNAITGNSGANLLNGLTGADIMTGGLGNDTYVVDNANDRVVEAAGGGTDKVVSSVSFSMLGQAIEILQLSGTANIGATGNELNNTMSGNAGANKLAGGAGNDLLAGGLGNDALRGEADRDALSGNDGNDSLAGGLGNDVLTGGAGNDQFVFDTALGATNIDHIRDFSVVNDTIRLEGGIFKHLPNGALSASAFKDITDPHTQIDANDHILYNHANGKLYYDADGSGSSAKVVFAIIDNHPANLSHADFLVI